MDFCISVYRKVKMKKLEITNVFLLIFIFFCKEEGENSTTIYIVLSCTAQF